MKRITYILLILLWIGFVNNDLTAQNWKKIVPLVSTCEDVKKIFKIEKCQFPYTRYETPEYRLLIEFAEGSFDNKCNSRTSYNVPKETILSVSVSLNVGIALKDFASDLSDFETKPESDLPNYFIYTNKKTGFRLTVFDLEDVAHTMVIQSIELTPSVENAVRFKCSHNKKKYKSGKTKK